MDNNGAEMRKIPLEWATIRTTTTINNAPQKADSQTLLPTLLPLQHSFVCRPSVETILEELPRFFPDQKILKDPSQPPSLPHPHLWVALVTKAILEAMTGQRPARTLQPFCAEPIYQGLMKIQKEYLRQGSKQTRRTFFLKSVHLAPVGNRGKYGFEALEAAVNTYDGIRYRAAALRIVPKPNSWVVEELELA